MSETRGGAGEAATCARLEIAELPSNTGLHPGYCVPVRLSWRGSCGRAAPLAPDMRRRPRPEQELRVGESESGGADTWGRHEAGTRAPARQPPGQTLWGISDQRLWSSDIPGTSHVPALRGTPNHQTTTGPPLSTRGNRDSGLSRGYGHHLASHEKHSKENRPINLPGDSGKWFLGGLGVGPASPCALTLGSTGVAPA